MQEPPYIPSGYRLAWKTEGPVATDFIDNRAGKSYWYVSQAGNAAYAYALSVHYSTSAVGPLMGTSGRDGEVVDVGLAGLTASYHDGIWALGAGPYQRSDFGITLHWETAVAHSLSVFGAGLAIAVRGSKIHGITRDELVRIAQAAMAGS